MREIKSPFPFSENFNGIFEDWAKKVWPNLRNDLQHNETGKPDFEYFQEMFGKSFYKLLIIRKALIDDSEAQGQDPRIFADVVDHIHQRFNLTFGREREPLTTLLVESGVACIKGNVASRYLSPDLDINAYLSKIIEKVYPQLSEQSE